MIERSETQRAADPSHDCKADECRRQRCFVGSPGEEPKHQCTEEFADDEDLDDRDFGAGPPTQEITNPKTQRRTQSARQKPCVHAAPCVGNCTVSASIPYDGFILR